MTTEVVFYILNSSDPAAKDQFTHKLMQKIHKEQRQADMLFVSENDAQRYDLALWNFKPEAFIPHAYQLEVASPIQIYANRVIQPCHDILINLHTDFQTNFQHYKRVIEILDQTQTLIERGRERFKQYRAEGIEPTVHKL